LRPSVIIFEYEVERIMKILVVDDEKLLVKGIRFNLESEGYQVTGAYDGEEAVSLAQNEKFDLIIMDLMLPKLDGLHACRAIRDFSDVPVIMLTAKSEDMDKIVGFEYGADDYVTKPFNITELKMRVKALLRRSGAVPVKKAPEIVCGDILVDTQSRTVMYKGQEQVMTGKEYDVVELLMSNPGQIYSREDLLKNIWGEDNQSDMRTVDVHIHRIREKLEVNPAEPEHIMTKWGIGYYFKN